MLDVDYAPHQREYAATLTSFCAKVDFRPAALPDGFWVGLGKLGVLGLSHPDSGAEPLDVAAAHEALGAAGCPGPLGATVLVVAALPDGPELDAVTTGRSLVAAGDPTLLAWAAQADLVYDATALGPHGGTLRRCADVRVERETELLGREPAGAVVFTPGSELDVDANAVALSDLALAAYLVGGGRAVLRDAAIYAKSRTQFRRPLASFQAIAHPIAQCQAAVAAAGALVRRAAGEVGAASAKASGAAVAVAVGSAAHAAREAVYCAHQTYGGIGFTAEGPLAVIGTRLAAFATVAEARWRAVPLLELLELLDA